MIALADALMASGDTSEEAYIFLQDALQEKNFKEEVLSRLAVLETKQGKLDKAQRHLLESIRIHTEKNSGWPEDSQIFRSLEILSKAMTNRENGHEELFNFITAIEFAGSKDTPALIIPLWELGGMYYRMHNLPLAAQFRQRSLDLRIKTFGGNHPSLIRHTFELGALYEEQKKDDKARVLLDRSIDLCRKIYGPGSLQEAESWHTMMELHHQEENYDKSVECGLKALAIDKPHVKERPLAVLRDLNDIAKSLLDDGKLDSAGPYIKQADEILKKLPEDFSNSDYVLYCFESSINRFEYAILKGNYPRGLRELEKIHKLLSYRVNHFPGERYNQTCSFVLTHHALDKALKVMYERSAYTTREEDREAFSSGMAKIQEAVRIPDFDKALDEMAALIPIYRRVLLDPGFGKP